MCYLRFISTVVYVHMLVCVCMYVCVCVCEIRHTYIQTDRQTDKVRDIHNIGCNSLLTLPYIQTHTHTHAHTYTNTHTHTHIHTM